MHQKGLKTVLKKTPVFWPKKTIGKLDPPTLNGNCHKLFPFSGTLPLLLKWLRTDLIFVIFSPQMYFWAQFFSTLKRVNCGKNFPKFPNFSQNFSTWQFFLHKYNLWYLWQIWALYKYLLPITSAHRQYVSTQPFVVNCPFWS